MGRSGLVERLESIGKPVASGLAGLICEGVALKELFAPERTMDYVGKISENLMAAHSMPETTHDTGILLALTGTYLLAASAIMTYNLIRPKNKAGEKL